MSCRLLKPHFCQFIAFVIQAILCLMTFFCKSVVCLKKIPLRKYFQVDKSSKRDDQKKWGNLTAHHDAVLKFLLLGGIVFNGKFHDNWIEVFHNDFPSLARDVEKFEGYSDKVVRNWTVCIGLIKPDHVYFCFVPFSWEYWVPYHLWMLQTSADARYPSLLDRCIYIMIAHQKGCHTMSKNSKKYFPFYL